MQIISIISMTPGTMDLRVGLDSFGNTGTNYCTETQVKTEYILSNEG